MSETKLTYVDYAIAFCMVFQVSEDHMLSPKRCENVAQIRNALWETLREAGWSYGQIGHRCGRDHTTVIHGIDRYTGLNHSPEFLAKVEEARALAPEIATQRAAGVRFAIVKERPPEKDKRPRGRKYVAPRPVPRPAPQPASRLDDDGKDYEQTMRAHVLHASSLFLEALRQEVEA